MNEQPPLPSLPDALYYPRFSINSLVTGKMWPGDGKRAEGCSEMMFRKRKGRGPGNLSQSEGRWMVSGGTSRIVPRGDFFYLPGHSKEHSLSPQLRQAHVHL